LTDLDAVREAVTQHTERLFGAQLRASDISVSPLAVATRGVYRVTAGGGALVAKTRALGDDPAEREGIAAQAAYEHDLLAAVWNALAAGGSGREVPRPRLVLPDRGLIVMDEAGGSSVLRLLRRWLVGQAGTASTAAGLTRCGEWLRRFATECSIDWPPMPPAAAAAYRAKRHRHHVYCLIELSGDDLSAMMLGQVSRRLTAWKEGVAGQVVPALEKQLSRLRGPLDVAVNVHGKYSVADVLVRDDGVSAVDLEQAGRGSMYLDPAYFLAQVFMSTHVLGSESTAAAGLRRAFLRGRFPQHDFDEPLLESFITYYLVNSLKPGDGIAGLRARYAARSWLGGWLRRYGG
jgi:hypothetical protein